jgi:hypothetical protein
MKIRTGFVSNSSSASYTIKLDICREDFIEGILNALQYPWSSDFEDRLKKDIEESPEKNDPLFSSFYISHKKKAQEFMDRLNKCKEEGSPRVLVMLDYYGIKTEFKRKNRVEVSGWTSMHNNFNEGMPDILKEILLYFMFDKKIKVQCEWEDEG